MTEEHPYDVSLHAVKYLLEICKAIVNLLIFFSIKTCRTVLRSLLKPVTHLYETIRKDVIELKPSTVEMIECIIQPTQYHMTKTHTHTIKHAPSHKTCSMNAKTSW